MTTRSKRGNLGSMEFVAAAATSRTAVIAVSASVVLVTAGCSEGGAEQVQYVQCVNAAGEVIEDNGACDGDGSDDDGSFFFFHSSSTGAYPARSKVPSNAIGQRVGSRDAAARQAAGLAPKGSVPAGTTIKGGIGGGFTAGKSSSGG